MVLKNVLLLILFIPEGCFSQFGPQQIIEIVTGNPRFVYSSDLDSDGRMDVLSVLQGENKIVWYQNTDGVGNFSNQRIITANLESSTTAIVADIDGDDDMDILGVSGPQDKVVWFENLDGSGTFGVQNIITTQADGAIGLYASDLDTDGDMDVLSASFLDNKIAWYENTDGLGTFGPQRILTNSALSTRDVYAADLDGDGDMDVIAASTADDRVIWFENLDGLGNFGPVKIITSSANGVIAVRAADIDGDGDNDVIAAIFGDGEISWYENVDGLGNFGAEKVVTSQSLGVRIIQAADIDKDGDLDIVYASAGDDIIGWCENTDGIGTFGTRQIITDEVMGAGAVFAADLDGDTDLDVISASIMDNKIAWYKNLTILGIQENYTESFSVYPNPVKNVLNIAPKSDLKIENINLFDALGRQVFQENGEKATVDFADISNGIYFLKLQTLNSIFTIKIIKE